MQNIHSSHITCCCQRCPIQGSSRLSKVFVSLATHIFHLNLDPALQGNMV